MSLRFTIHYFDPFDVFTNECANITTRMQLAFRVEEGIDVYLADTGFRSRDPRFKDYDKHKPKERLKAKEQFNQDVL